jgi:signal recognition particle subunit SEC65
MSGLMQSAVRLAKSLGLPLTHRNLYVIEKAIEAEKNFRQVEIGAAVEIIRDGAMAEAVRGGELNYFFFEDCRWRYPRLSAAERRQHANRMALMQAHAEIERERAERATEPPPCTNCNDRGYVFNYGPGKRTRPCPECQSEASV